MSDRQSRKQAVTQADVARHAGVSGAVVSYVVHGGPRPVAPETALRVRASIEALGYRPNASAAALRTGSSRLLGLVVPDIGNSLWADLAVAAGRSAADRGYDLITASSEGAAAIERQHIHGLAGRQVEGLLVTVVDMVDPDVAGITGTGIPTVLLNVFSDAPGASSIGVDALRGAADGVSHLLGHGYDSVGLIIHPGDGRTVELREQGWEQALGGRGPVERGPSTRQGGYEAALRLFGCPDRPRSVFVSSDMQAVGCLRALWELGLRVPQDVAVVSFDGTADSGFTTPPLTVVRQPVEVMARQAVDLVLDGGPARRVVEPATLTIRSSCGC